MIKAINKIGFASKNLLTLLARNYGELVYTNEMKVQDSFDKVPTFRAYDLDGKLINKKIKYDTDELVKILKTMIFVDEMDDILLKVKGQGIP
jgi:hypothetical protein